MPLTAYPHLPERPSDKKGILWWRSLNTKEKMEEVRPLIEEYLLTNRAVSAYLDISFGAAVNARANLTHEIRSVKCRSGEPLKKGERYKPSALVTPTRGLASEDCRRAFPRPFEDVRREDIEAIMSLYGD